jgi:hypothetical protein
MASAGATLWRALASRRLTIALLIVALAVSATGVIASSRMPDGVPAPSYHGVAPAALASWPEPASTASRLAGVGLGALAALSLVRLLQSWVPGWAAPPPEGAELRLHQVPWTVDEAWEEADAAVSAAGLRLERLCEDGDVRMGVARRSGLRGRLGGASYLGVLLLLAASLVARWSSWAGEPIELALGETHAFGQRGELQARLEEITIIPGVDGGVARLTSTLGLAGAADSELRIDTLRRASVGGLALYQLGYGPAVRVAAFDGAGQPLRLQAMATDPEPRTVARFRFSGRQQEHLLAVPEANMVVRMVHYPSLEARGIAGPVLQVRVERGIDGLPLADEFLTEGRRLAIGGVTLDIGLEYYVVVRAAREPHLAVAALGAALVVLGVLGRGIWPERRVWVAVQARESVGTLCQLVVEPYAAFAEWLAGVEAVLTERARSRCDGMGT